MPRINLLPKDLSPKSSIARASQIIKKIGIVSLVAVVISALGLIAFFTYISFQLRNSNTRQEQLKTNIKSLEQTEQRFVLTKDRLDNAKKVLGEETAAGALEDLTSLFTALPGGVEIREAQISSAKTELSLVAKSSSGLAQTLAAILATDYYKQKKLSSFAFNTNVGYVLTLVLNN
ncbi:MAG: hypothetical protein P8Y17_00055 [Patescibacteria group bacterium]|jgi:hypothetical protein